MEINIPDIKYLGPTNDLEKIYEELEIFSLMSNIKEIKEENINSVSGGLLVNDDSKRQGWHCSECHYWFGDTSMLDVNGNIRDEQCPVCNKTLTQIRIVLH